MEHPWRNLVGRCCEWHQGRYKWQAVVTPCSLACLQSLTSTRDTRGYVVVKDELGTYLRDSRITIPSLVVDAEKFGGTLTAWNAPRRPASTWVPEWARVLLALGSRMKSKRVPRPWVDWPRFLSLCGSDEQVRCAVVAAVQVGAEPAEIRDLIAAAVPKVLSVPA